MLLHKLIAGLTLFMIIFSSSNIETNIVSSSVPSKIYKSKAISELVNNCTTDDGQGRVSVRNADSFGATEGCLVDYSHWPVVNIVVVNKQEFWMKIRVTDNLNVTPQNIQQTNIWAQAGYIPPGASAEYKVTFHSQFNSAVQFFVNGAATEPGDNRPSAAILTTIDKALSLLGVGLEGVTDPALITTILQDAKRGEALLLASDALANGRLADFLRYFKDWLTDDVSLEILQKIAGRLGKQVTISALKHLFTLLEIAVEAGEVWRLGSAILTGSYAGSVFFESKVEGRPIQPPSLPPPPPIVPAPTPTPSPCSSGTGVTLYADANYSGICHTFDVGVYPSLADYYLYQNISSIIDPNGQYNITLYDQPYLTGTPVSFDKDTLQLTGDWDNRARSMRVERRIISSNVTNISVALIIDSSGSMVGNDPQDQRKKAAKYFIDLAQPGDKIAVVDFDDTLHVWAPLRTIQTEVDRVVLRAAVDMIDSDGNSNLGAGLHAGYNELVSDATNNKKAAIFLTDGQGSHNNEQLLYKNKRWPIFSIGLSSDADTALLHQIALDTGGRDYTDATPNVLQNIYEELSGQFQHQTVLDSHEFPLFPDQVLDFTAPVAIPSAQLTFTTSWPGSDVGMRLRTPSGAIIDANTIAAGIYHAKGPTYEVFRIDYPEVGNWGVQVQGLDVSAAGELVRLNVSAPITREYLPLAIMGNNSTAPTSTPAVPTLSPVQTLTPTTSSVPSNTPTTQTSTNTATPSPSITPTATRTPTVTRTSTPTKTPTRTPTNTPTATPGQPPALPSNLQATALSPSEIRINWRDNSTNETGFAIYDGNIFVANVGANIATYTVGGLAANSYHCLTVYAFNNYGSSAFPGWACATTTSKPTITLNPTSGPSGTLVTITGSGWPYPGDTIFICCIMNTSAQVDSGGNFSITYPVGGPSGSFTISFNSTTNNTYQVDYNYFTITP
jgi:hypothetical protein